MPKKTKTELTPEAIIAAIQRDNPKTLTALARALGYKGSVSSWLRNKLKELVPDLDKRIAANKSGETKPTASKPRTRDADKEGERLCPYKRGKYRFIWLLLYRHRKTGISRQKILDELEKAEVSDRKTGYYAITVVASPTREGKAHRSADRAADAYFCLKEGENIRLVMRDRKF